MSILITIVFIFLIITNIWSLYCNNKTYDQRSAMLDAMCVYIRSENYTTKGFNELMREYEQVSCYQHLFSLMRFRDPMKLYDTKLLEIMND